MADLENNLKKKKLFLIKIHAFISIKKYRIRLMINAMLFGIGYSLDITP